VELLQPSSTKGDKPKNNSASEIAWAVAKKEIIVSKKEQLV